MNKTRAIAKPHRQPAAKAEVKPATVPEFLCPYFAEEIAPSLGMGPEEFDPNKGQDPCFYCRCTHEETIP